MTKFVQMIAGSTDQVRLDRATRVGTQAALAQDALINRLQTNVAQLKADLSSLTDLAPDSTTSLKIGGPDFRPVNWVEQVHALKVALKDAVEELDIALSTKAEFFAEVATTTAGATA